MRIVFLGDSLIWGGYGGNFVNEVAAKLPQQTIINAGHGGNTVVNLLRRLDDVLLQEPDGVFVMVGGNDAIAYSQPETRGYFRRAQKLPNGFITPDEFSRAYRDLLTGLQLAHTLAWVGLEPTEVNPEVLAAQRLFNGLASDAARSLNVPVLDLMTAFTPPTVPARPPLTEAYINLIGQREREGWSGYEGERQRNGYTYSFDGAHLTPESARRMGELVADFLRAQIERNS